MITDRELNLEKLPDQAKVWVNLALKYTHGYGAVAVPVNEMDSRETRSSGRTTFRSRPRAISR